MRPFLLSLLALPLAGPALAQTAPTDTTRFYKHHLGLTASPVLDHFFSANRSLPVGLLYKRQTKPNRALRLRLVGNYRSTDSTDFGGTVAGTGTRAWQVAVFAGYEWQRRLGQRFSLDYGVELGTGVGRNVRRSVKDWFNTQGPFYADGSYTIKTWYAQARPFVGVSFRLSQHMSAFAEAALPFTYSWQREGYSGYMDLATYANPTVFSRQTGYSDYKTNRFTVELRPVQLLGLTYQLQ